MASGYRLNLTGLKAGETAPPIAVVLTGRDGKVLHTAAVAADGRFDLPADALKNANRVLVGPATQDAANTSFEAFAQYRPAEFTAALEKGEIAIARAQWELWRIYTTCVTGHVKLCRRSRWWYDDLVVLAKQPALSRAMSTRMAATSELKRLPVATSVSELIAWPYRCSVICNGRVDVYRRTCCCQPWIVNDPRLDDLLKYLEEVVLIPVPIPGPDPGPESPQVGPESAFFRDGALDTQAVFAKRDLMALRKLPAAEIPAYINARAYLRCRHYSCSTPVKVGEGDINPDGRFNICWRDWPRPLRAFCHVEYAYKVQQHFGLGWITVYDGVAANIWFGPNDDAELVSYSIFAFGCRDNGDPGTGTFVYLDVIGDTGSNELETPASTGWDRVAAPGATSGLVFPTAVNVLDRHRNWGGTLKLNYMFSEDLRLMGATHYRISVTAADNTGAPVGPRHYYQTGLSWTKAIGGGVIVPVNLGPNPVGGENYLYQIPYDAPDNNWESDQYHAHLDTTDPAWSDPLVRHLVTIEIFDNTGKRLRPNGTPATGQGGSEGQAPFTYRRKTAATGPTTDVPFGALTHMFWWDNRPVHVEIVELVQDGVASTAECQFMVGTPGSQFSINYRAYHEQVLFNRNHAIWWKRGLAGATGDILNPGLGNVGFPGAPGASPSVSFGTMLGTHKRCAFTVFLGILGKMTDGDNLNYPYAEDTAAFALEIS
ncbi:MAG TPA: hypothetical protein VJN96_02035 [Vicinamibacterales bacterium]|nr:hypothetical protein [Vicinamibacterales bacterium]